MSKGFFIDETKCTGCKACVVTCKDKCGIDAGMNLRTVTTEERGSFPFVRVCFHSKSCHNCKNPACVENCPTGAMNRDNDLKIVRVDTERCIGCGTCAKVCPFGAPTIDESSKKCKKCDFCYDLIKNGKNPACVDVCNARALDFGELDDLKAKYAGAKSVGGETKASTLIIKK